MSVKTFLMLSTRREQPEGSASDSVNEKCKRHGLIESNIGFDYIKYPVVKSIDNTRVHW